MPLGDGDVAMCLDHAGGEILDAHIENRIGGIGAPDVVVDLGVDAQAQPVRPRTGIGRRERGRRTTGEGHVRRAWCSTVVHANDQRFGPAIQK